MTLRMTFAVSAISLLFLPAHAAQAGLRHHASGPETAVAMAGVKGTPCPKDEYLRFKNIVCPVAEACGCADKVCKLEWCSEFVHKWRNDFGACNRIGCGGEKEGGDKEGGD
eukprot:CAMPEP_0172714424 /NCGR_PEP_ID=MMETSP1074-20121228/65710_1 /TAXON_ID=2916 /ORGANISM="Ceratium fusus, Strain PA161109" /LENGTH=110 /DNA_ID=CAMNT_0013538831 /DNA_START=66 /DNA_END=398 /DNA_ORIENTATION=+